MSKIILAEQSSAPDTPGSGKVAIFVDTNGDLAWKDDAGNVIKIASAGAYTLTIPATGTAALLGTAQEFTAEQTFSNALVAPGMKPASDSTTALQLQNAAGTAVVTVDTTNKYLIAPTFRTVDLGSLADDTVTTLSDFPVIGLMCIWMSAAAAFGGIIKYRAGASSPHATALGSTGVTLLTSGTLTNGTSDGTDNTLNILFDATGIKVKNRIGAAANIRILYMG